MTRTLEGPTEIEYKGRTLEVKITYSPGLYAGDSGYKEVVATACDVGWNAQGTCGANFFPVRLATWLACRRAVKAVKRGEPESEFDQTLGRLDDRT